MSQTRLLALVFAALLAVAGGWYFGTATQPVERTSIDNGKLMFPDLAEKLKDARRVEITNKGNVTVIALKDGVWGIEDRGGYPVQETKLRGLLTGLTELRLAEPRTSDPTEYARLGVEDPTQDRKGTASLLRVLDGDGKPIVTLIVGHRKTSTQGDVPEEVYVRRPAEAQSWLAEGSVQADADPQVWLDRNIINIAPALITKVVSNKGGATIELTRDGDKLKVTQPADPPKLDDYKVDEVGQALSNLTFQDVRPINEPYGDKAGEAVFSTSDGMDVTVTLYHLGKDSWTRFAVAGSDKTKPNADRLNTNLANWAFETGIWKDAALVPSLDDLKAPPPTPPAKPAEPPATAAPKP